VSPRALRRSFTAGARLGLRNVFQYRGEVAVQLVSAGAMCMLVGTLWSRAPGGAFTAAAVLGQIAATAFATRVNEELGLKIRDGSIVSDLTRPLAVPLALYSRDIGRAAGSLLLVGLPLLIVATMVGAVPRAPAHLWALWALSLVMAHTINVGLSLAVGAVAAWSGQVYGMQQVKATLVGILSGTLIPLAAMPDAVQPWVERMPFWVLAAGPARIVSGDLSVFGPQLFWAVASWSFGLSVWWLARRRITGAGG
jgi:ABC-2 type transport system permease protein